MAIFNENEKKIVWFSALAHGYTHFYMMIFTATNVVMGKEFNLSLTRIGDIGFFSNVVFGFGALSAGFIISRIRAKSTILVSVAAGTFFTFITAFSQNPFMVTAALIGVGLSGSIYHPAGLTLVSNSFLSRGRGLAYHGIGGTLGLAIAPMIAGFITENLGWRWAYGLLAIPGIFIFLFGKLSNIDDKILEGDGLKKNVRNNRKSPIHSPLTFLVLTFAMQICFGLFFTGTTIFLPAYSAKMINIPFLGLTGMALGGFYTTISLVAGVGGQWMGGELSERFKLYKLQLFVLLVSIPSIYIMGITRNFLLIISMLLFSLFAFTWQPIGNGLVAYYTPSRWRGYAYSISFALSFGVGALASAMAGRLADSYGMQRIFVVMAVIGLFSLIFSIPLWLLNRHAEKE